MAQIKYDYQVIVVGGGHAGIEAALATSRLGKKTLLVTLDKKRVGAMPCNPSIGGPAKGIVVREIDALGGEMAKAADKTALQFKMLNLSKGPGVQALRVQSDKLAYSKYMLEVLEKQSNLTIEEGLVEALLYKNNAVYGVKTKTKELSTNIVILTTGTYMNSAIMVSSDKKSGGPDGQETSIKLSNCLKEMGIALLRLKTGTPARLHTASIDFSKTSIQPGSRDFFCFSYQTKKILDFEKQLPCYLTYTNEKTHEIIRENLGRSSMYSGVVTGTGTRYCPSIEDKIVRFADKPRHQIFLEPETADFATTYVQGFSTSLPYDVQEEMLHSLPGLENAEIAKYAYAIEYDAIDPLQLLPSLECKLYENLFSAGQINGTSGYEEAGGQGLMAGINACRKLEGKEAVVLGRDQAYIGVLIDDLVTKGTKEPYRLLTSRAEYRLLLRHDNADERLIDIGYEIGLVSEAAQQNYLKKQEDIQKATLELKNIKADAVIQLKAYWQDFPWESSPQGLSLYQVLKRPHVSIKALKEIVALDYRDEVLESIDINLKYEGYIVKAQKEAEKLRQMDELKIPGDFDYASIDHLSLEARQKLLLVKPQTLGQASRISGVNPADIAILLLHLKPKS